MVLTATHFATLAVAIAALLCFGCWVNLFRAQKDWRYELFYFDFAIGAMIMALVLGLTLGNLGFDGFTFFDDILHAGRRQEFYALSAGIALNLGTMLMLAAVTVSGMAFAFPVTGGLAAAVALTIGYVVAPHGNSVLLFTGIALMLVAVCVNAVAFQSYANDSQLENMKAGQTDTVRRRPMGLKATVLSVIAGLSIGVALPVLQLASFRDVDNELGLGPYALAFLVVVGVVSSAFIFNLVLMNVPVDGKPLEILDYFRVKAARHLIGLLAGLLWCGGLVAGLVAAMGQLAARVAPQTVLCIVQGSVVLAALCGLLVWREYDNAGGRVKAFIWVALVLLAIGLTLASSASNLRVREVLS